MALHYTEVNERIRELRNQYYEAMRRQDLEGFFRKIALKQLQAESKETAEQ
jgi:hypothetical protein